MILSFDNDYHKPKYSEYQLRKIIDDLKNSFIINRVIQKQKDFDYALKIVEIQRLPNGITIIVI